MSTRRLVRHWILGPLSIVLASTAIVSSASGADSLAGRQGTDTSLPLTESAVTVSGRGSFESLKITVNQTKNLTSQAVSLTWEGGDETITGPGRFAGNFLQVFQCWGDDDGSVISNPGPPPEQCAQGAVAGTYEGVPPTAYPAGFGLSRVISKTGWDNFDESAGEFDTRTGQLWLPFRAVDGEEVGVQTDPNFRPFVVGGNFWLNPYYNVITTNEIVASTGRDGKGAELFSVATGLDQPGLGCGQKVEADPSGQRKVPKCWIVVVPRSTPAIENAGTPFADRADQFGVFTSPVAPAAWENRIAIPIEFNPVESPCSLSDTERRIAGNELALAAVNSWQPALCSGGDLPPYSYAATGDSIARRLLVRPTPGSPGMVVVQRPVPSESKNPANPIVYAPVSASGVVIGFNIERIPRGEADAASQALAGVRVAELNLTPRLVAKLLTQSYTRQVEIFSPPPYDWIASNPQTPLLDPDFLQFNPEFATLQIFETRNFSGFVLPGSNADAAVQVWEWILADPEAKAWMSGQPDEWGMTVNPRYNTSGSANPSGFGFAATPPDSFPKADPYCYQAPARGSVVPPPLCGTDWMPYVRSFNDAAQATRRAFDGARISENTFAIAPAEVWRAGTPQYIGRKAILSLTDTASAARFGIQTARLSNAGDNGPDRTFVAADSAGLAKGLAAMRSRTEPDVLEPTAAPSDKGAYPLVALSYAAITPLSLDAASRAEYAAFLDYAAGPGQVPGPDLGQLPVGYVPLSSVLATQTAAAADAVRELQPVPAPTAGAAPTVATTSPASPTAAQPGGRTVTRSSSRAVAASPTTTTPPTPAATDAQTEAEPTAVVVEGTKESVDVVAAGERTSTPQTDVPVGRIAVPLMGGLAIAAALGALELTKRPRRAAAGAGTAGTAASEGSK